MQAKPTQIRPDSPALLAACDYAWKTGSNITDEQVRWIIEAFLEADQPQDAFQPGLALIDVERQLARVTQERDQDRDPHHPDSLACRLAEAKAREYATTQAAQTKEKAREDAERNESEGIDELS